MGHLYTKEYSGMAANVKANLNGLGLHCDFVTQDNLILKERYVDQKSRQQFLRVDTGESIRIDPYPIEDFNYSWYDAVVMSDYEKGFIAFNVAKELTQNFSGLVFVDSKKKDLSCFENSIIKINESEAREAHCLPNNYELVTTLGERGARWNDKIYSTNPVDVFDASGAGDSFFAGLIVSYLISNNIEEAINFANKCARIAVQKSGTYAVTWKDVENDLLF
jgi:D-beta-D-heptose 7-phosphate kinase/D-beta-D-heptose 1-phosphate adenosyltransferase